jgi:hypothetical protein
MAGPEPYVCGGCNRFAQSLGVSVTPASFPPLFSRGQQVLLHPSLHVWDAQIEKNSKRRRIARPAVQACCFVHAVYESTCATVLIATLSSDPLSHMMLPFMPTCVVMKRRGAGGNWCKSVADYVNAPSYVLFHKESLHGAPPPYECPDPDESNDSNHSQHSNQGRISSGEGLLEQELKICQEALRAEGTARQCDFQRLALQEQQLLDYRATIDALRRESLAARNQIAVWESRGATLQSELDALKKERAEERERAMQNQKVVGAVCRFWADVRQIHNP